MPQKFAFSAIICEFDPLHYGHRLLLEKAGASGRPVCCVMSGNFVQRGAPAMLDKWDRARLALQNGADLVFELPLSWACAGAERFAAGGVALASALGAGALWFGSEAPDPALLLRLAEALLSPAFSAALARQNPNLSFAVRRQQAAAQLLGEPDAQALRLPNANLGVEYCKAILRQEAKLTPTAILRQGAGHDEKLSGSSFSSGSPAPSPLDAEPSRFHSAGELRGRIFAGQSIAGLAPESTVRAVEAARSAGRCPAQTSHLERAILCRLRSMNRQELAQLPDMSEGLENRFYQAARRAQTLEELYASVKSKRYSHARVRRIVLAAFLGLQKPLPALPPYLRLLGCSAIGREALGRLSPTLPLVVRPRDVKRLPPEAQAVFAAEALADDLYALSCPIPQPAGRDYTQKLTVLSGASPPHP